jgi:hypothetical protein
MVRLPPTFGNMRHHLIGAIDSVLVIKCPSQADDGSFGSKAAFQFGYEVSDFHH